MTEAVPNWGPAGETVYQRTYSRKKPDGSNETWFETVERVVQGNLSLVHGDIETWPTHAIVEGQELIEHMLDFRILPAGRHLWASGVKGRQYLMNCWTSGWGEKLSDHFDFTFMRLMEGGGVGANYSSHFLTEFGLPRRQLNVHVVCDPAHADYQAMLDAGLLSAEYDSDWDGSYEVEDSREGWSAALVDLVDTYMTDDEVKHSERVYDVSRVRPEGARLKTFGGTASGPGPFARMMSEVAGVLNETVDTYVPTIVHQSLQGSIVRQVGSPNHLSPIHAMRIDHAIAQCVVSGGVRRSARMSMVRWDDPAIFDFIACKLDESQHWTTNISVEIDDDFIFDLNSEGNLLAHRVHAAATKGMLTNGEPGYWNSSLSNVGEVNPVYTTNPCGEITLEQWEACNLGHVNLDAFSPTYQGQVVDEAALERAHQLMTRFLIRATFADFTDPKAKAVQDRNRRIGVGHFGVQGFLAKQGLKFSSAPYSPWLGVNFHKLLGRMKDTVRDEARSYAFELRIPEPVKVTTVAPTGSIAKLPGVTEGIHPVMFRYFIRRIRFNKNNPENMAQVIDFIEQGCKVEDDIYDTTGNTVVVEMVTKDLLVQQVEDMGYDADIVEASDEISLDDLLAFQAMYQEHYADNAVSFTASIDAGKYTIEEASAIIAKHLPKLKGTTIMPNGTRAQAPYEKITQLQYENSLGQFVEDSTDEDCLNGACPIR